MNRPQLSRPDAAAVEGSDLTRVETPCLVIDREKLLANIAMMTGRARDLGVKLRPHLKTAKSIDVARLCVDAGDARITVSTLKETEYFAAAGFGDILYAVGIAPNKLAHAAALCARGVGLTLLIDNADAARAIAAAAAEHGVDFAVMIEVDTDGHRAGLKPTDAALVALAREISSLGGMTLRGVLTHAGGSYDCTSIDSIVDIAEAERAGAVLAAERIRAAGLDCPEVSVGSTPTARFARSLEGVTELRAGVYVFFDLVMAGLAVCRPEEIALSVLATVIGHQPDKGWLVIDAGWMAMSRDRGTAAQALDQGYGAVCDVAGRLIADLIVSAVNQEHGMVARRDGAPLSPMDYPVGSLLRILPNHACATAAQHDGYLVVEGESSAIVARWPRINGW
jgi:D-serine deaminase-like pyridoxal phosphate-dependent protein